MNDSKPQVVRVARTEFELSDGRVDQHVVELDEVPTLEEFQEIYDQSLELLTPDDGREAANYG